MRTQMINFTTAMILGLPKQPVVDHALFAGLGLTGNNYADNKEDAEYDKDRHRRT